MRKEVIETRSVSTTESIGQVIRKAREKNGMTQKELAKACGIASMYVSQLETGERFPSIGLCQRLAKPLDLDETELLRILYQAKTPHEFQEIIDEKRTQADLDDRFERLSRRIMRLPKEKREQAYDILEVALKSIFAA